MRDWRVIVGERDYTFTVILFAIIAVLMFLLAYLTGDWTRLSIEMAYMGCMAGMLIWPLLVMSGQSRQQDRILDKIRAAYVMATGDLMAGREDAARKRLKTIRRLERLWRYGASRPYRLALLSYLFVTTAALAIAWQVFAYHLNSLMDPKGLMDTVRFLWSNPWLLAFMFGFGIFFMYAPFQEAAQIKSRPWAKFYGDRLQAALKAGRGVEFAPQHEGTPLPPDGVSARELLGLNPGFTKADLRRAWVRLAGELHPDRWTASGEGVRGMKEAALKRVNAARDELMARAI